MLTTTSRPYSTSPYARKLRRCSSGGFHCQPAVQRGAGNFQGQADGGNRRGLVAVELLGYLNARVLNRHAFPTAHALPCAGSGQPGLGALLDQPPLELRQGVKMWKTSSPDAVVVSIAPSQIDLIPTPRFRRSSTRSRRWRTDRPRRSNRQTRRVSPGCNLLRQSVRPGRSDFEPDILSGIPGG